MEIFSEASGPPVRLGAGRSIKTRLDAQGCRWALAAARRLGRVVRWFSFTVRGRGHPLTVAALAVIAYLLIDSGSTKAGTTVGAVAAVLLGVPIVLAARNRVTI